MIRETGVMPGTHINKAKKAIPSSKTNCRQQFKGRGRERSEIRHTVGNGRWTRGNSTVQWPKILQIPKKPETAFLRTGMGQGRSHCHPMTANLSVILLHATRMPTGCRFHQWGMWRLDRLDEGAGGPVYRGFIGPAPFL